MDRWAHGPKSSWTQWPVSQGRVSPFLQLERLTHPCLTSVLPRLKRLTAFELISSSISNHVFLALQRFPPLVLGHIGAVFARRVTTFHSKRQPNL